MRPRKAFHELDPSMPKYHHHKKVVTMASGIALSGRALLLLGLVSSVSGSTVDHRYKSGEHVELWVNKVGYFCILSSRRLVKIWVAFGDPS